ncbi:MAG: hypothetical protein Q4E76_01180 [Tissierellia bacterium]|nr:hypothetical protein [Tissierellia bacterium]
MGILLIFLAAAIHVLARALPLPFRSNTITLGLYTVVILFWMEKNRRVILHREVARYLGYLGLLLIAYLFLRTVKYELAIKGSTLERYLWYSYYIVLIGIGVFLLFSVLYLDKAPHEKIHGSWRLMYGLLFVFSLLFLTNDFHQLIFSFPLGLSRWSQVPHGYGPLFHLMLTYCGAIVGATFYLSAKKLFDARNMRNTLITFSVPVVWGLYTYFYLKDEPRLSLFFMAFKSPEFNVLITISYIESLIYNRLLPVNLDYEKFWCLSSLDLGMVNHQGRVFANGDGAVFPRDFIVGAEGAARSIDEDSLLESARISTGHAYWRTDISLINEIKRNLQHFGDLMAEENELLEAENQLKLEQARLQEQMELWELIDESLEDQIVKLEEVLGGLSQEEAEFLEGMKLATLINVSIKRCSNMLLLSQKAEASSLVELRLALDETLRYLALFGVMTHLSWEASGSMALSQMLLAYEIFEEVLEGNIDTMEAVLVNVRTEDKSLCLTLEIEHPKEGFEAWRASGEDFSREVFVEEGTLYVRVSLPLEGGQNGLG